ncbi:MAG: ABC transporter ATP-binding protein [Cypionkella sp.]|uniref:ABC transporter ATP-binding protein n=1 Tax=Cypionkella sp. TaxID=2811411 RepID=UPI002ABAC449|nr:ABC transporter ATP-binding protein [Cypionkella sp.]MDZ4312942.1 ABC transporter ATP-binding protein [Cypionkella sp.]MDZ4392513.1 ABC transporter ATP-binding protein [Cypionkella sp.]
MQGANRSGHIGLSNLSLDFTSRGGAASPVLRDISLDIPPRSIVGLVGESGSGKSTVALAFMGLLTPNARVRGGQITLRDRKIECADSTALAALRGREFAMIFQDPTASLNPVFTIGAHLHEVLRRCDPQADRAARQARAVAALGTVGFDRPEARMRNYVHELSGGMRQRVVIAMALLARPSLLIADEPTTALDVTVEAQVMAQMCALRDEIGCSILLITHSLGLVARYCDQVAVIYAGEIVERGAVADVVRHPAHPYTADLFTCDVEIDAPRANPPLEQRFQVIPGELPALRDLPKGCIYAPRCAHAVADCTAAHPDLRALAGKSSQEARCILTL